MARTTSGASAARETALAAAVDLYRGHPDVPSSSTFLGLAQDI